jgi:hypothetical protein
MSSLSRSRLAVESLETRECPAAVLPSRFVLTEDGGYMAQSLGSGQHILEGQECLVFYLGGAPSESLPQYWVFGTELPEAQVSTIQQSLLIAKQQATRDATPYEGAHALYQDIVIPTQTDPFAFTQDGRSSGL